MKKEITFCDVCGKEINKGFEPWNAKMPTVSLDTLKDFLRIESYDLCSDCCRVLGFTITCKIKDTQEAKRNNDYNKKITTKPRIATINTVEDLYKAEKEKSDLCTKNHCDSCRLNSNVHHCMTSYLAEEIEVAE